MAVTIATMVEININIYTGIRTGFFFRGGGILSSRKKQLSTYIIWWSHDRETKTDFRLYFKTSCHCHG